MTPGGCILQVWFCEPGRSPNPKAKFLIIETGFADFGEAEAAIEAETVWIRGAIMWTRRHEANGCNVIKDRSPVTFRGEQVARVQLPRWRFVEEVRLAD